MWHAWYGPAIFLTLRDSAGWFDRRARAEKAAPSGVGRVR
jgi:hypothetical protein